MAQKILNPIILTSDMDSYKAVIRLRENLDAVGVHNIGVTGPYGSGKSSVIKTLIAEDKGQHHFLELSLATLDDKEAEKDEKKIEANLLKQMIYREKHETLPNSRFRRVQFHSCKELFWKAVWIVACIIAISITFEPSFLRIESFYKWLDYGEWNAFADLLALLFLLGTLVYVAAYLVRTYGRSKLSKLNVSDGEIELKEEESVLSEHLAEILYFFQETVYDVVVFEDLDRFENKKIFLKLRELNYILNKSEDLNGRNIRFIYAVKDDMFKDSSRTKFFDYIVTVIPVMNMSNARNLLKKELKDRGFKENEISDDDLRVIALFIDDMRLLTNIANEYEQYHERLISEKQRLEAKKLLAIIVYKNYYPKDFSALHNEGGKVYKCIKEKRRFAKFAIENVLAQREHDLDVMEQNQHLTLKDLRMIYVQAIIQGINTTYGLKTITLEGRNLTPRTIWEDESLFNKFIGMKRFTYNLYQIGNTPTYDFDFKEIEKQVSDTPYEERVKAIRNKCDDIDKQREEIAKEKNRIKNYSLSELILKFNLKDEDIYKKIGLSPMADIFLNRGLIAEDYYNYISYFYEGMITQSDRKLLLDMNRNETRDFDSSINKVENFFKELPSFVYNTDAVLNTALVDYIAGEYHWLKPQFDLIIDRLRRPEGRLDFLVHYFENGKYADRACLAFMKDNGSYAWKEAISNPHLSSDNQRETMLEIWFRYAAAEDIRDAQIEWLNGHYGFLSSREQKVANLETIFENCKFDELDDKSEKLLQMAIDSDAYTITAENLCVIFRHATGIEDIKPDEITYGRMAGVSTAGLQSYLKKNINDVLKVCTNQVKDEEEPLIMELLNDDRTDDDVLKDYLTGQVNSVTKLSDIDANRIGLAIDCDVVKMLWPNVLHYYSLNKLDERLKNFIVKYAKGLSEKECKGDGTERLFTDIVANTSIPLTEFKLLIKSFNYYIGMDDAINWQELDVEKLKALVDADAIEYDEESRKVMKATKAYAYYLTYYKKDFLKDLASVELTVESAKELLVNNDYTLEEKLQIADALDESLIDSVLSDMICGLLRKQRLDLEGSKLNLLVQLATTASDKLFVAVLYIGKNIGYKERVARVIGYLPSPYDELLTTSHPKIEKTPDGEALLRLLETGGYISVKVEEKDGKEYMRPYTKYRV